MNTTVGIVQHRRAEQAVAALGAPGVAVLSGPELALAVSAAVVPGLLVSGLRRLGTFATL